MSLKSPKPIEASDEIRELKTCLNDLVGILALPSIWSGRGQHQVITVLIDAVHRVLELDFAYAHLNVPDGKRIEVIRIADSENPDIDSDGLRQLLTYWLKKEPGHRSSTLGSGNEYSQFGLTAICLGPNERMGVFVAGSARSGFPSKSEKLILNVAANEAATGIRESRLLNDQNRAQALGLETARQKEELVLTSRQLKKQNERRKAAEEALRLIEARLTLAGQATAAAEDAKRSEMAGLGKRYAQLTPREREVLPFVVAGRLSKQTAAELGTSEITIRVHRGQIMRKMQAHSLAELIRMADSLGIRHLAGSVK